MVKVAIEGFLGAVRLVGRVLEEKDDAVDGVERGQGFRLEGQELLELDALDTELFEEVCEDALFVMDRGSVMWPDGRHAHAEAELGVCSSRKLESCCHIPHRTRLQGC